MNKQNQNKKTSTLHSNWPRILLLELAHKQCSGIIKGWLHCLTSSQKEDLLSILLFGSVWCLFIAQIQFSLMKKKNKDWTSRTLANPTPPTSNNISFLRISLVENGRSFYAAKLRHICLCVYRARWTISRIDFMNRFSTFRA